MRLRVVPGGDAKLLRQIGHGQDSIVDGLDVLDVSPCPSAWSFQVASPLRSIGDSVDAESTGAVPIGNSPIRCGLFVSRHPASIGS